MPLPECNTTILDYNKGKNLAGYRKGISESQYCAYDPAGTMDSCEGDSGGPLHIGSTNTTLAQIVGIVSFSATCGSTLPSIYTRVAFYLDWIEQHVWPNDKPIEPLIYYTDEE